MVEITVEDLDSKTVKESETKKPEQVLVKSENETDTITQTLKDGSFLLVLATFFGFGLLLSFTPCIFPMIPILSSIIVQQSNKDGGKMSASKGLFLAVVYVLAMSVAYTVAGVSSWTIWCKSSSDVARSYCYHDFCRYFCFT